jgi:hypothetical protein
MLPLFWYVYIQTLRNYLCAHEHSAKNIAI